jgi:hypothetical protein
MKSPYNGNEFKNLPASSAPTAYGAGVKLALFAFFVGTRALHPLVIDASKSIDENGKKYFAYGDMTVVLCENVVTIVAMQAVALMHGGVEEWKMIWRPEPLKIFSLIGLGYAFGDYMEMCSMGALGGAAYQILLQSKLIITALLTWYLKGIKQSTLQWNILLLIVVSMSAYTIGSSSSGDGDGGIPIIGLLFVIAKVFISCLCAVLTDKYMRDFKDEPIHVQIVQFKFSWIVASFAMAYSDGKTFQTGFFNGWSGAVVMVWASFTMKNWCTNYILAILDSLLKNIGEAVAVLVIYLMQVALPVFDTTFELPTFLAVLIVILAVTSYINAKEPVEKAAKYDAAKDTKV